MQWINDRAIVDDRIRLAKEYVRIDEQDNTCTPMRRLVFDSAMLSTRSFREMLNTLSSMSGDAYIDFLLLEPSPEYHLLHFGKYPLLRILTTDSADDYIAFLNADPGGSPADAVGVNCRHFVIHSSSQAWFIRGLRHDIDDYGGRLWVPVKWISHLLAAYQFLDEIPAEDLPFNGSVN
jgi:hypothetical protein